MSRGPARRQVVRVGDRVRFDAAEYEVLGREGTLVRLAPAGDRTPGTGSGASVVLLTHLLAAADFAVLSDPGPGARTGPVTVLNRQNADGTAFPRDVLRTGAAHDLRYEVVVDVAEDAPHERPQSD